MLLSNGIKGNSTDFEPFARITCSALIMYSLSPPLTSHVLAFLNLAQPEISSTFAALSNVSTPLFNLFTIDSFHETNSFMSTLGLPETLIPILPFPECASKLSKAEAACIIAFEGIHPLIRQVPPAFEPSTITVSKPSCPALIAAT